MAFTEGDTWWWVVSGEWWAGSGILPYLISNGQSFWFTMVEARSLRAAFLSPPLGTPPSPIRPFTFPSPNPRHVALPNQSHSPLLSIFTVPTRVPPHTCPFHASYKTNTSPNSIPVSIIAITLTNNQNAHFNHGRQGRLLHRPLCSRCIPRLHHGQNNA